MKESYPLIDLFAGAGGLSEGFSSFTTSKKQKPFKIALSIEKDPDACCTLLLRSFYKKFESGAIPEEYWQYLRGNLTREELFKLYPKESLKAAEEVKCMELGKTPYKETKIQINKCIGNAQKWVLVGGPPCQAYSMVGRSRMKNTNPDFENDERHFLYLEYLKILADFTPPVFVMENVQGILSAKHFGNRIVEKILDDLRNPHQSTNSPRKGFGYRLFSFCTEIQPNECEPEDFLVQAEKFGIPQARHRVLILGIRNDINITPCVLRPNPAPTVKQVIGDLPRIRSALSKEADTLILWKSVLESIRKERWYIKGATNGFEQTVNKIEEALNAIGCEDLSLGQEVSKYCKKPKVYEEWYRLDCADIIINHTSRTHMRSDLLRYLFTASYAAVNNRSAHLCDFPEALLPIHKNVQNGINRDFFSDRFKVQLEDKPSTTITSHIAKDGHYFIHYDPTQCRSLTVREAARLQTFPDNFKFEGTRTSQYRQVGNAVPPLLSLQIAEIIYDILHRINF